MINYNQTVERASAVHVAPTGLESTCVVLVTGLDLLFTLATPARKFDMLGDEFPANAVLITLTAMILGVGYLRSAGTSKKLAQAWA